MFAISPPAAGAPQSAPPTFGWMLGGRSVLTLEDALVSLDLEPRGAALVCYQCGICTVACELARASAGFPRRTLGVVQQAGRSQARQRPEIWQCHHCGDCTSRCPNQVNPADILVTLRRSAIAAAVPVPSLVTRLHTPLGFATAFATVLSITYLLANAFGTTFPGGDVRYSHFLPHSTLVPFFAVLSAAGVAAALWSVRTLWRWTPRQPPHRRSQYARALLGTVLEALSHRRHRACGLHSVAALRHMCLSLGMVGLLATTGYVAGVSLSGGTYPLSFVHPAKLLGNAAGLALTLGSGWAVVNWYREHRGALDRALFDGLLPILLVVLGMSGLGLEWARASDSRALAYPLYAVHLASAALLLTLWPWTKMAHATLRLTALVATASSGARRPDTASLSEYPSVRGRTEHRFPSRRAPVNLGHSLTANARRPTQA